MIILCSSLAKCQCWDAKLLGKLPIYLKGLRLVDGELSLGASDHFDPEAMRIYDLRWEIETLSGCLKGRGFKLEETHVAG
jgi:hypothetical protein